MQYKPGVRLSGIPALDGGWAGEQLISPSFQLKIQNWTPGALLAFSLWKNFSVLFHQEAAEVVELL